MASFLRKLPSNRALFKEHELGVQQIIAASYRDGEDVQDMVGVVLDTDDPLCPTALAEAVMVGEGADNRIHALAMPWQAVENYFGGREPAVSVGQAKPSSLERFPVLVIANRKITLHIAEIQPLVWVAGGEA